MNDRFKFRAWSTEDKEFFTWEMILKHCELSDFENSKFIFQQCLGLKDKNGKLIYEGDIIKTYDDFSEDYGKYEVVWMGGSLDYPSFDLSGWEGESNGISELLGTGELEIIGNIYENPELLRSPNE